jgi:hypothetical protein
MRPVAAAGPPTAANAACKCADRPAVAVAVKSRHVAAPAQPLHFPRLADDGARAGCRRTLLADPGPADRRGVWQARGRAHCIGTPPRAGSWASFRCAPSGGVRLRRLRPAAQHAALRRPRRTGPGRPCAGLARRRGHHQPPAARRWAGSRHLGAAARAVAGRCHARCAAVDGPRAGAAGQRRRARGRQRQHHPQPAPDVRPRPVRHHCGCSRNTGVRRVQRLVFRTRRSGRRLSAAESARPRQGCSKRPKVGPATPAPCRPSKPPCTS